MIRFWERHRDNATAKLKYVGDKWEKDNTLAAGCWVQERVQFSRATCLAIFLFEPSVSPFYESNSIIHVIIFLHSVNTGLHTCCVFR